MSASSWPNALSSSESIVALLPILKVDNTVSSCCLQFSLVDRTLEYDISVGQMYSDDELSSLCVADQAILDCGDAIRQTAAMRPHDVGQPVPNSHSGNVSPQHRSL